MVDNSTFRDSSSPPPGPMSGGTSHEQPCDGARRQVVAAANGHRQQHQQVIKGFVSRISGSHRSTGLNSTFGASSVSNKLIEQQTSLQLLPNCVNLHMHDHQQFSHFNYNPLYTGIQQQQRQYSSNNDNDGRGKEIEGDGMNEDEDLLNASTEDDEDGDDEDEEQEEDEEEDVLNDIYHYSDSDGPQNCRHHQHHHHQSTKYQHDQSSSVQIESESRNGPSTFSPSGSMSRSNSKQSQYGIMSQQQQQRGPASNLASTMGPNGSGSSLASPCQSLSNRQQGYASAAASDGVMACGRQRKRLLDSEQQQQHEPQAASSASGGRKRAGLTAPCQANSTNSNSQASSMFHQQQHHFTLSTGNNSSSLVQSCGSTAAAAAAASSQQQQQQQQMDLSSEECGDNLFIDYQHQQQANIRSSSSLASLQELHAHSFNVTSGCDSDQTLEEQMNDILSNEDCCFSNNDEDPLQDLAIGAGSNTNDQFLSMLFNSGDGTISSHPSGEMAADNCTIGGQFGSNSNPFASQMDFMGPTVSLVDHSKLVASSSSSPNETQQMVESSKQQQVNNGKCGNLINIPSGSRSSAKQVQADRGATAACGAAQKQQQQQHVVVVKVGSQRKSTAALSKSRKCATSGAVSESPDGGSQHRITTTNTNRRLLPKKNSTSSNSGSTAAGSRHQQEMRSACGTPSGSAAWMAGSPCSTSNTSISNSSSAVSPSSQIDYETAPYRQQLENLRKKLKMDLPLPLPPPAPPQQQQQEVVVPNFNNNSQPKPSFNSHVKSVNENCAIVNGLPTAASGNGAIYLRAPGGALVPINSVVERQTVPVAASTATSTSISQTNCVAATGTPRYSSSSGADNRSMGLGPSQVIHFQEAPAEASIIDESNGQQQQQVLIDSLTKEDGEQIQDPNMFNVPLIQNQNDHYESNDNHHHHHNHQQQLTKVSPTDQHQMGTTPIERLNYVDDGGTNPLMGGGGGGQYLRATLSN